MFVVEITSGALAGSSALLADALDFLGDTMRCGNSLAVIGMSVAMRASAALFKAGMLALPGPWGFGFTLWQVLSPDGPRAAVTGEVDVMALAASLASVGILPRSEDGAADMRSVWLCSRNDAIANVAGIIAAGVVAVTGTAWPDLAVAGRMAGLFLWSATSILRQAPSERATGKPTQAHHPPSTPPDAGKSAEQFPASRLSPVYRQNRRPLLIGQVPAYASCAFRST